MCKGTWLQRYYKAKVQPPAAWPAYLVNMQKTLTNAGIDAKSLLLGKIGRLMRKHCLKSIENQAFASDIS